MVGDLCDMPEKKYFVNCPYCWAENEVAIEGDYKVRYPHPSVLETAKYDYPPIIFWKMDHIKNINEILVQCTSCKRGFHLELFPYSAEDERNSKNTNYYLNLGLNRIEKVKKKFLLEDIIDQFCTLLHIKYPLGCFLFILIPGILFWIFPIIALGGFSKLSHDSGFFFLFVLFVLMLILLKRHVNELKDSLSCNKLPILLHEKYKKSNWCRVLEERTFKGNIFGHPYKKMTPPTFCGLVAVVIFIAWQINFTVNIASTFYETPYPGGYPFVYTSYIVAIACAPFFAMIYFIIGNIAWIFMATTALIGLMTRHMPLEINPLKEMGGTEVFGKMMLSSLYSLAAIGAGIPIAVIWSISQEFYVLLVCTLFVSLFVFLIAFGFFYPLWPIHKKLKERKEKEQNEILSRISLSTIKEEEGDFKDTVHTHLLLDTSNKISSMLEWPFKTDTLIKACSAILVPFISLGINIVILFLTP